MIEKINRTLPRSLVVSVDDTHHYMRWDRKAYSASMIAANAGVDESEIVKSTYHYSVSLPKESLSKNDNPPTC